LLYVPGVGFWDLMIVWGVPVIALLALPVFVSLATFGIARRRAESALKADVMRRLEMKKGLASGAGLALSPRFVARLVIGDSSFQATLLYRVSHTLWRRRMRGLARLVHGVSKILTSADLAPGAEIGGGLYLYHGMGTVIGKGVRVGERALVCQGVTLGGGPVVIGDDVNVWAGAKVLGKVTVGDRADIGANAVVVQDVPADTTAIGVPATRLLGHDQRTAR
jgi:serine O-acetyltransferase